MKIAMQFTQSIDSEHIPPEFTDNQLFQIKYLRRLMQAMNLILLSLPHAF